MLFNSIHTNWFVGRVAGFCIFCALKKQLGHMLSDGRGAIAPMLIVKNVRVVCPTLRIGRQEDAHEFLRFACIHEPPPTP